MGRAKPKKGGLGRSLTKAPKRKQVTTRSTLHSIDDDGEGKNLRSVTESNDLEEFLNSCVIADTNFEAEREQVVILDKNAFQVEHIVATEEQVAEQLKNKHHLAVPRRPPWDASTTAQELDNNERTAFLEWRRNLVEIEKNEHLVLTPFEKNLEVWRQLWRVVERSDVVIQIVDSRNPLLFYSRDLVEYIKEVNPAKNSVLLLNKADLLTTHQRKQWAEYFKSQNIDFRYFSAYNERVKIEEAQKQAKAEQNPDEDQYQATPKVQKGASVQILQRGNETKEDADTKIMNTEDLMDFLESLSIMLKKKVVVGMVGYPNVGKSSTINVLCKEKRVAESATPGKTKHFQTIILNDSICLCDCPGLVFPSFIATKADMVCNGLLPIDQMRDHVNPIGLVCYRIPRRVFEQMYGLTLPQPSDFEDADRPPTPYELLQQYGKARGFMASHGMPDEPRSARYILKDYVSGRLLFAHPPPNIDPIEFNKENYANIPLTPQKSNDTVSNAIEEMQTPKKVQANLYQGKRKKKRTHLGEGQETVQMCTKGFMPKYGQRLPTNVRL